MSTITEGAAYIRELERQNNKMRNELKNIGILSSDTDVIEAVDALLEDCKELA